MIMSSMWIALEMQDLEMSWTFSEWICKSRGHP